VYIDPTAAPIWTIGPDGLLTQQFRVTGFVFDASNGGNLQGLTVTSSDSNGQTNTVPVDFYGSESAQSFFGFFAYTIPDLDQFSGTAVIVLYANPAGQKCYQKIDVTNPSATGIPPDASKRYFNGRGYTAWVGGVRG